MIHIITQHFATQAWFEIQKRHLQKYTKNKSNVKVNLLVYKTTLPNDYNLPENYSVINLNDYNLDRHNEHYLIVESSYDKFIRDNIADDDIVIYMDSDAFPIDYWDEQIEKNLETNDICAVYRFEDRGPLQPEQYTPYPHLCFYAFKKKTREKYGFRHEIPPGFPCPGFTICDVIRENNLSVKKMVRTNKFNSHNVMFGIYDDIIYHSSCGSRAIIGRPYATIGAQSDTRKMCYEGQDFCGRAELHNVMPEYIEKEINELNLKIFDAVYEHTQSDLDCNFLRRYYLGKP